MSSFAPHHSNSLLRVALAVGLSLGAVACGELEQGPSTSEFGRVQMALTAVGSDGDTYRLRNATLDLSGPMSTSVSLDEAYGDAPVFEARVDVGEYTLSLAEGWILQRASGDGFVDVMAEMVSPNPMSITVEADALSVAAVIFETVDAEVEFATGDLEVWLGVNHLDCEHGETVTRSCGANLTGRQFRVCAQGWWQGWSECSARCDRGYCLFREPNTFEAATVDTSVSVIDFASYASGSVVPEDFFGAVAGDVYSDEVSFASVGASNQMFPEGSDTPFIGQKHEDVVGFGGGEAKSAGIRSSAGARNFSGFDGLEAIFDPERPTYVMSFSVDHNVAGFAIEIHNEDCDIVAELPISPSYGTRFIVIGDPEARGIEAASSVILSPGPSEAFFGTEAWTLNEFAFAR